MTTPWQMGTYEGGRSPGAPPVAPPSAPGSPPRRDPPPAGAPMSPSQMHCVPKWKRRLLLQADVSRDVWV